jgi:hypothetical protein
MSKCLKKFYMEITITMSTVENRKKHADISHYLQPVLAALVVSSPVCLYQPSLPRALGVVLVRWAWKAEHVRNIIARSEYGVEDN